MAPGTGKTVNIIITMAPGTGNTVNIIITMVTGTSNTLSTRLIVSPVRSTYGGYYGLVVVTPRPRPHFIVYAITLKNLIGLLPYFICRLI